jgi:hypothetical protein
LNAAMKQLERTLLEVEKRMFEHSSDSEDEAFCTVDMAERIKCLAERCSALGGRLKR